MSLYLMNSLSIKPNDQGRKAKRKKKHKMQMRRLYNSNPFTPLSDLICCSWILYWEQPQIRCWWLQCSASFWMHERWYYLRRRALRWQCRRLSSSRDRSRTKDQGAHLCWSPGCLQPSSLGPLLGSGKTQSWLTQWSASCCTSSSYPEEGLDQFHYVSQ